jgi:hypothetical protein
MWQGDVERMPVPDFTALISAASGLCGVLIGGWISSRNQRQERRQRFIRDQLTEFYAPLLGMRERLRAGRAIRLKVTNAAGTACSRHEEKALEGGIERHREWEEKRWPGLLNIIEENIRKQEAEDIPLFRQMLDLFTSKLHLAEPTTHKQFGTLVEFVELWEDWLHGSLPGEVAELIGPNEENLSAFYADLEANFTRLQEGLKE